VEHPRADTHTPDFGVRVLGEETLRRGEGVVSDDICATVNVDGYDFPSMSRLDLRTNVSVVYFVAALSSLLSGIAGVSGGHRVSPDAKARYLLCHVRLYSTREYHASSQRLHCV
jgi:hypothetical protein